MQRRLILLRHAKSSWSSGAQTDHERPLNGRGRRDAPRVAAELLQLGWEPERVSSSDSQRTQETWQLMSEVFDDDVDVDFDHELYGGGLGDIQEATSRWPDGVTTGMVIGHNPGWESAASHLCGEPLSMTTCNAVLLEGEGDTWLDALERKWTLVDIVLPRELD